MNDESEAKMRRRAIEMYGHSVLLSLRIVNPYESETAINS